MNTANAKRDAAMWRMLEERAFPQIRGRIKDAPVPTTGATNIVMHLQIRQVSRLATVTIYNCM